MIKLSLVSEFQHIDYCLSNKNKTEKNNNFQKTCDRAFNTTQFFFFFVLRVWTELVSLIVQEPTVFIWP